MWSECACDDIIRTLHTLCIRCVYTINLEIYEKEKLNPKDTKRISNSITTTGMQIGLLKYSLQIETGVRIYSELQWRFRGQYNKHEPPPPFPVLLYLTISRFQSGLWQLTSLTRIREVGFPHTELSNIIFKHIANRNFSRMKITKYGYMYHIPSLFFSYM